jgi:hypothetical protein
MLLILPGQSAANDSALQPVRLRKTSDYMRFIILLDPGQSLYARVFMPKANRI